MSDPGPDGPGTQALWYGSMVVWCFCITILPLKSTTPTDHLHHFTECFSPSGITLHECFRGHSYAFILVTRFDMSFKTELLKTPGLLQSRWAECAQWPVMNHTYWGAWWGGRMECLDLTGPQIGNRSQIISWAEGPQTCGNATMAGAPTWCGWHVSCVVGVGRSGRGLQRVLSPKIFWVEECIQSVPVVVGVMY